MILLVSLGRPLLAQERVEDPTLFYLRYLTQQRQVEEQRQEEKMSQIYQAYPQNPQLYRYLERNPRYIEHYLGK